MSRFISVVVCNLDKSGIFVKIEQRFILRVNIASIKLYYSAEEKLKDSVTYGIPAPSILKLTGGEEYHVMHTPDEIDAFILEAKKEK